MYNLILNQKINNYFLKMKYGQQDQIHNINFLIRN